VRVALAVFEQLWFEKIRGMRIVLVGPDENCTTEFILDDPVCDSADSPGEAADSSSPVESGGVKTMSFELLLGLEEQRILSKLCELKIASTKSQLIREAVRTYWRLVQFICRGSVPYFRGGSEILVRVPGLCGQSSVPTGVIRVPFVRHRRVAARKRTKHKTTRSYDLELIALPASRHTGIRSFVDPDWNRTEPRDNIA
jgi:hypothetical protein